MARPRERVPLVYILSNGRSGTTLLDLLLGSAPAAWTVGEAQLLPRELIEERRPCGCGRPVKACPFWSDVLPRVPLDGIDFPIHHFRESYGAGKVLRWGLLWDLLRGRATGSRKLAAEAYGRVNAEYLHVVREVARSRSRSDVQWVVDASMDPYRLLWLRASGRFEIRVVHLFKSPEAFVYSMVKDRLPAGRQAALRMAGRWLVENALMVRLCRAAFDPGETRRVRYERLAGEPEVVRREMEAWLEIDLPTWEGSAFRQANTHGISGGRTRWSDTPVQLDRAWREQLPTFHRTLARLITVPLAQRLGY